MNANALLLKLKAYDAAKHLDTYTEDDLEHDVLVLESYLNPIERTKGGSRRVAKDSKKTKR